MALDTMTDWKTQAEDIKQRLEQIGIDANEGFVPQVVVDEVKDAVDFCRTSLWAAQVSAARLEGSDATTLLVEARLHRMSQMASSLLVDIAQQRLQPGARGAGECLRNLRDAVIALEHMLGNPRL